MKASKQRSGLPTMPTRTRLASFSLGVAGFSMGCGQCSSSMISGQLPLSRQTVWASPSSRQRLQTSGIRNALNWGFSSTISRVRAMRAAAVKQTSPGTWRCATCASAADIPSLMTFGIRSSSRPETSGTSALPAKPSTAARPFSTCDIAAKALAAGRPIVHSRFLGLSVSDSCALPPRRFIDSIPSASVRSRILRCALSERSSIFSAVKGLPAASRMSRASSRLSAS